jgi:Mg-chelatase subunit ChlD
MKKFFNDLFGNKEKEEEEKPPINQVPIMQQSNNAPMMEQLPMEQLPMEQFPVQQQSFPVQQQCYPVQQQCYPDQLESEHRRKENYDLTNDKIPVTKKVPSKLAPPPITNPNEIISLKLRSNFKKFSKKDYDESQLPLLVTIETEDIENEDLRQGLDLVLVIDISGSMEGEKIELVRETLVFVLDELEARDRVCMIKFDSYSTQITGFKSMTDENKEKLKKLVEKEIRTEGSTDIRAAMATAFEAMLSREEENDSTAVFLLSDGEDTCGNSTATIKEEMTQGHKKMTSRGFKYQTHSFGYGSDHDEKVLSMISDTTSGNFYYIKTNKHVDECFIDCFGYLMSVIASQIRVNVTLQKGFIFKELFSISWKKKNSKEATLEIHGLAVGKTMDYITEIGIDKKEIGFENNREALVARAVMKYMYDDKEFVLEQEFPLTFVDNEDDKGEPDPEVEESYTKAKGARIMEKAKDLHNRGLDDQAQEEISKYHKELEKKDYVSKEFKEKISQTVKMDFVRHEKDFMQVNKMMCENAYNPAYINFSKMNRKQMTMLSKKKGY